MLCTHAFVSSTVQLIRDRVVECLDKRHSFHFEAESVMHTELLMPY